MVSHHFLNIPSLMFVGLHPESTRNQFIILKTSLIKVPTFPFYLEEKAFPSILYFYEGYYYMWFSEKNQLEALVYKAVKIQSTLE